jgi:hypothetical protein
MKNFSEIYTKLNLLIKFGEIRVLDARISTLNPVIFHGLIFNNK